MAFHVEVSAGLQHARSFNLDSEELRRAVLEPWLSGRAVELGDRNWDPEESKLLVLEGPELSNPELSFGQGWANAQRGCEEVTARVLGAAQEARGGGGGPAAMVIETDSAVRTVAELASTHRARSVDLDSVSEQIDGRDPEVAAVIVVVQRQR
ncbi:MAG TPA: hypothetical protein VNB59_04125 [Solirubrobacterales bacterium]|jgi:hypothetical protein|nr:hypothetical protein [Solirubrobacterales bacterium]